MCAKFAKKQIILTMINRVLVVIANFFAALPSMGKPVVSYVSSF